MPACLPVFFQEHAFFALQAHESFKVVVDSTAVVGALL
jgi:hypothetical protein